LNNIFDRLASADKKEASETDAEATQVTDAVRSDQAIHSNSNHAASLQGAALATTEKAVKDTAQELLRSGSIDEARKSALFRASVTHEHRINQILEPFDLLLKLDTHRGVAWLAVDQSDEVSAEDAWSHPLVRRQRLTLEQSLLVALLRQAFAMHEQKHGVGQSAARIPVEDLLPQYLTYFKDTGSDTKNESRLLSLLDQLKTYAIVSEVDKNHEVTIHPMIAHLANPESLNALLKTLQAQASAVDEIEADTGQSYAPETKTQLTSTQGQHESPHGDGVE